MRRRSSTKKNEEEETSQDSMGCLFLLLVIPIGIVIGFLLIAIYDFVLPSELRGSFSIVIFPVMLIITIVSVFLMKTNSSPNGLSSTGYKEQDPSICKRIIKNGYEGEEIIIRGDRETTFAQACKEHWYFESANMESKWHIEDDYAMISQTTLSSTSKGFLYWYLTDVYQIKEIHLMKQMNT